MPNFRTTFLTAAPLLAFALTAGAASAVPPSVFAPATKGGASASGTTSTVAAPPVVVAPPSAKPTTPAADEVVESVPAKRMGKVNGHWVFRGDDNTYMFEPTKEMKVVRKPSLAQTAPAVAAAGGSDVAPLVPEEKRPNLPSAVGTATPPKKLPPPTAGAKPAAPAASTTEPAAPASAPRK